MFSLGAILCMRQVLADVIESIAGAIFVDVPKAMFGFVRTSKPRPKRIQNRINKRNALKQNRVE